jgi:hypothetical protein
LGYIGLVRKVKDEDEDVKKESYIDMTGRSINEGKTATVNLGASDYEVEIIDGTHLKMRPVGGKNWGIPMHFNQVNDEVIDQLKEKGLARDRFFNEEEDKIKKDKSINDNKNHTFKSEITLDQARRYYGTEVSWEIDEADLKIINRIRKNYPKKTMFGVEKQIKESLWKNAQK